MAELVRYEVQYIPEDEYDETLDRVLHKVRPPEQVVCTGFVIRGAFVIFHQGGQPIRAITYHNVKEIYKV